MRKALVLFSRSAMLALTITLLASSLLLAQGGDKLQRDLDAFAKDAVTKMNAQLRPGIKHKKVTKVAEGYRAEYMAVDPASLTTSYKPSKHKAVPYVGSLNYHEVEYVCVAKTQKEALDGPFTEVSRRPMLELIKYMNGKWTH